MESEGPYSVKNYKYRWCVAELDEEHNLNQFRYKKWAEWWASQLNTARAEGRKAAEKDFKELLELLNKFRSAVWWNGGLEWVVEFEDAFDAWKKARGIE